MYCTSNYLVFVQLLCGLLVYNCVCGVDLRWRSRFIFIFLCLASLCTGFRMMDTGQRFPPYYFTSSLAVSAFVDRSARRRSIAEAIMAILVFGVWVWALASGLSLGFFGVFVLGVLGLVLLTYLYSSILWLMVWYGLSRLLFYRVTINVFVSVSTEQVRCMLSFTVLILLFSGPVSFKMTHYSVILNLTTSNLYNDGVRKG